VIFPALAVGCTSTLKSSDWFNDTLTNVKQALPADGSKHFQSSATLFPALGSESVFLWDPGKYTEKKEVDQ